MRLLIYTQTMQCFADKRSRDRQPLVEITSSSSSSGGGGGGGGGGISG
jgi:hypothetical protein